MTESAGRIIAALKAVPPGKVSSYRDIALSAGLSGSGARQVVRVLHALAASRSLPWHRIVRADGRIGLPEGPDRDLQTALLRSEGVAVDRGGRVDPSRFTGAGGSGG
jgi:methylated-DNA-protein-cysteine methyltransferase-like protein